MAPEEKPKEEIKPTTDATTRNTAPTEHAQVLVTNPREALELVKLEGRLAVNEQALKTIHAERHAKNVNTVLDLKVKAGLIRAAQLPEERKQLESMSDDALNAQAALLTQTISRMAAFGPQAEFDENAVTGLEAQIEDRRALLYAYRRDGKQSDDVLPIVGKIVRA